MKKQPDKPKEVTAASLKRIAKALRVRARNHQRTGRAIESKHKKGKPADMFTAIEVMNQYARGTLRAMR